MGYSVEGDYFETCGCTVSCQCVYLSPDQISNFSHACPPELEHFLLQAAPFLLAAIAGLRLGTGDQRAGGKLGLLHQGPGLLLRLGDRLVGGALGQQESAVQHVLGLAGSARIGLDCRYALGRLPQPLVERLDRGRGPLEKVVHDVVVIAPEGFGDLDVAQFARCDLHGFSVRPPPRRVVHIRHPIAAPLPADGRP